MLKPYYHSHQIWCNNPAAFRRLCVETSVTSKLIWSASPAAFRRLCVETNGVNFNPSPLCTQPPSGGCVLKHRNIVACANIQNQPPSGGCVLKHQNIFQSTLCHRQPPSGGCVLKPHFILFQSLMQFPSRLQAAVC